MSGCTARCAPTCSATTWTRLGADDADPAAPSSARSRRRPTPTCCAARTSLLDLFADVGSLYRPRGEIEPEEALVAGSTQEYLLSYLQWLDADRAGLPDSYRRRLEHALLRYGVRGLDRTPELEEAVVWMFRSFRRVGELVPAVTAILERRLRHHAELAQAGRRRDAGPA